MDDPKGAIAAVGGAVVDGAKNKLEKLKRSTPAEASAELSSDLGAAAVGILGEKGAGPVMKALDKAGDVANAVPNRVARVISNDEVANPSTLGAPGAEDVFVTDPADIAGLDANGIADKLTIPKSESGFHVIEFDTPNGIASPVSRDNPGFIGGGKTAGGAKEFVVPNQSIPEGATKKKIE